MKTMTINGTYEVNYYSAYDSVNGQRGFEIRLDGKLLDTVLTSDLFHDDERQDMPFYSTHSDEKAHQILDRFIGVA